MINLCLSKTSNKINMNAEVTVITPAIAERLLLSNVSNRIVNARRVSLYSGALTRGEWKLNGESIKIAPDGRLLDGQHRLQAIVQSGIPMTTWVVKNVPNDVFDTIDTGKARGGSDTLKVAGAENTTSISSGIIKYFNLLSGTQRYKIENHAVLTEYSQHPEMYQNLYGQAAKFYHGNHRIVTPAEYIGYYRYFQTKYSNEKIEAFYSALSSGEGVPRLLRDILLDNLISNKKRTVLEKQALTIKAFIYFVSGKVVKQLKMSVDEKFPTLD